MTNAVKFANQMSSRNTGVIIADLGDRFEVRPWINVTSRWAGYTWMVEKRWIGKSIKLSPMQERGLHEVGA